MNTLGCVDMVLIKHIEERRSHYVRARAREKRRAKWEVRIHASGISFSRAVKVRLIASLNN